MLLSEARARVLRLVDDDSSKYNVDGLFTDIDDALKTAQIETWQTAVASGNSIFVIEAPLTTGATGIGDLTTIKPMKLVNVALKNGTQRLTVPPARFDEAPTNAGAGLILAIAYVPRVAFPSASGNPFVWASANIADLSPLLDKLMCVIAASELKIIENEDNNGMERRKTELRLAVSEMLSIPSWSVLPLDGFSAERRGSGFAYVMPAPDTLQLVLA